MICPECGTQLDNVPVGDPCPTCGSQRRSATVTVETVAAVAGISGATDIGIRISREVGHTIDAVISAPAVQRLAEYEEILLRIYAPYPKAPGWHVTLEANGKVLGMAQGEDVLDITEAVQAELDRILDEGPDIVEDELEEP